MSVPKNGEAIWYPPPTPTPPPAAPPPVEPPMVVAGSEQLRMEEQFVRQFESQMSSEEGKARELFERQLMSQLMDLPEQQRLSAEVGQWIRTERGKFEAGLREWKEKQYFEFQKSVDQWRREYRKAEREYVPSIAERMLAWTAPAIELGKIPLFQIPVDKRVLRVEFDIGKYITTGAEATVAAGAGIVGGFEQFWYGVMRLAGMRTPAPPPTVSGAIIETGVQSIILGKPTPSPQIEEMKRMKYPVTYAAATILPDIMMGYVISKGVEKVILQPAAKAFRFSRLERLLIKRGITMREGVPLIKGYWARRAAKEIAPQIVSIPRLPTRVGVEWLKRAPAVKGAWELMLAPRAAGLLVTPAKVVTPAAAKALPRLTVIGALGVQPFVRYALPPKPPVKMKPVSDIITERAAFQKYKWTMPVTKEGLFVKGKLPTITELLREFAKAEKAEVLVPKLITVPKKIISPLAKLPTAVGITTPSPLAGQILGAAAFVGLKAIPSPVFAPTILKAPAKPKLMPIPTVSELMGLAPIEVAKEKMAVTPVLAAMTVQMQKLMQVQISRQIFKPPTLLQPPTLKVLPRRRKEEEEMIKRRRRRKGVSEMIFGRIEYKFPIAEPKGVAAFVLGTRK